MGDLKPKSNAGYDNLSSKLLKDIKGIISRPLSVIINHSLCSGIFPSKLKLAKVIPLYKKEDQRVYGNYRPIPLLSSISKMFENVAFKQILQYFTSNNLLLESEYGFRENHSTELAALEFIDRIKLEMDRKKIPFSIFLDPLKAFDTLNHDISITKLRFYGIQGIALNWFQSYLTKWSQYVQYNDTLLAKKVVTPPLNTIKPMWIELLCFHLAEIGMIWTRDCSLTKSDTTLGRHSIQGQVGSSSSETTVKVVGPPNQSSHCDNFESIFAYFFKSFSDCSNNAPSYPYRY